MIGTVKGIIEETGKQSALDEKINALMNNWLYNNVMATLELQKQIEEVFEEAKKNASESTYCDFNTFYTWMAEPTIRTAIEAQKDFMLHMLLKKTL